MVMFNVPPIHVYHHMVTDSAITDKLDQILRKLGSIQKMEKKMGQAVDDAIVEMTASSEGLTTAVDSLTAFVTANADAQIKLAEEMEAQGQDATELRALSAAQMANAERIVALVLQNTPQSVPVPDPVPSPDLTV